VATVPRTSIESDPIPMWLRTAAAFAVVFVSPIYAAEHEVNTRANQWAPIILFIEPGDSVVWVGMEGHETELIEGMGPEDVMLWRSELGEEGFRVTFVQPGAYIYKCDVHLHVGMIGAVVVGGGEPPNLMEIDAALADIDQGQAAVRRVVARMKRELSRR
jgi:plastocyanin